MNLDSSKNMTLEHCLVIPTNINVAPLCSLSQRYSMCSPYPPPQGITHCRPVTNRSTAECRMSGCIHDCSRQIASFNSDRLEGRDRYRVNLNITTTKSLLAPDLETEEAMETCDAF
ncbi:hypothetical protein NPIL_446591 [Nephila pilipes]|uniref:Uncharacterized protein n=1 Tax=Nephila pilipes TaxID=299642 RepID=A0A8X6PDT1_NEPPI|nr:hypothetical protein NPIL_446591 [Nephila pilipes]